MRTNRKSLSSALADDFDAPVSGASKIAEEPTAPPAVDETAEAPSESAVEAPNVVEPSSEPTKAEERPKRTSKAEKVPPADPYGEALAKFATGRATEFLNARITEKLDDALDDLLTIERRSGRPEGKGLTKQQLVNELLVKALADHGRGVLG